MNDTAHPATSATIDELFAAMLDELMTGRIRVNCLDLAESPAEDG
jgi:hypothetical protein